MVTYDQKLFAVVDTLDPFAYRCEDLVGDCVEDIGQLGCGNIRSEDLYAVAGMTFREIGYVDHAGIHTDVADRRASVAAYKHAHGSATEMTVNAVGISHRYCGNPAATQAFAMTTVADSRPLRPFIYGYDGCIEGADRAQAVLTSVVHCLDAVKAYSEAHHVIAMLGEADYAGGIKDMPEYGELRKQSSQTHGCLVEIIKLHLCVGIFLRTVGHGEVAEY